MKFISAARTHVGMKRSHNEDSFLVVDECPLFVVADGMGGHSSGEVASKIAVDTIANFFRETKNDDEITWPFKAEPTISYEHNRILAGIKLANLRIYEIASSNLNYKGMGTTIVSLLPSNGKGLICHVGDSRAYLIRNETIRQLTEDHSLLNDYMKIAQLSKEEIKNFPHKNIIVRALGMKDKVQIDTITVNIEPEDIFLLCTDGLTGEVNEEEILKTVLEKKDDLDAASDFLIEKANQGGGKDNITLVIIRFLPT